MSGFADASEAFATPEGSSAEEEFDPAIGEKSLDEVEAGTPLEERLLVDQDLYRERKDHLRTYTRRRSSPHIVIERCKQAERMVQEQSRPLKEITQVAGKRRSSRHSIGCQAETTKRARIFKEADNDENDVEKIVLRPRSLSRGKVETKDISQPDIVKSPSKEEESTSTSRSPSKEEEETTSTIITVEEMKDESLGNEQYVQMESIVEEEPVKDAELLIDNVQFIVSEMEMPEEEVENPDFPLPVNEKKRTRSSVKLEKDFPEQCPVTSVNVVSPRRSARTSTSSESIKTTPNKIDTLRRQSFSSSAQKIEEEAADQSKPVKDAEPPLDNVQSDVLFEPKTPEVKAEISDFTHPVNEKKRTRFSVNLEKDFPEQYLVTCVKVLSPRRSARTSSESIKTTPSKTPVAIALRRLSSSLNVPKMDEEAADLSATEEEPVKDADPPIDSMQSDVFESKTPEVEEEITDFTLLVDQKKQQCPVTIVKVLSPRRSARTSSESIKTTPSKTPVARALRRLSSSLSVPKIEEEAADQLATEEEPVNDADPPIDSMQSDVVFESTTLEVMKEITDFIPLVDVDEKKQQCPVTSVKVVSRRRSTRTSTSSESIKTTPSKVGTPVAKVLRRLSSSLSAPKMKEESVDRSETTLNQIETPVGRVLRRKSTSSSTQKMEEEEAADQSETTMEDSNFLDSTLDMSSTSDSDSDYNFEDDMEDDDDDDVISWDGDFVKIPNTSAKLNAHADGTEMEIVSAPLTPPDSSIMESSFEGGNELEAEPSVSTEEEELSAEDESDEFKIGQPVLAKVGKWPFWPAFVVPFEGQHKKAGNRLEYHVVFCGQKHLRSWIYVKKLVPCQSFEEYTSLLESSKEKHNPYLVGKKFKDNWRVSMDEMLKIKDEPRSVILEMYEVKKQEPKQVAPKITPEEKQQLREHLRMLKRAEREELKMATKMKKAKMIELKKLRKQKMREELRRIREEAKGHITRNVCFKCRDHNNRTPVVRCSRCDNFYHHSCEPEYTSDAPPEIFVCTYCTTETMPCHMCHTHSPDMVQCRVGKCQKVFHLTCLGFKWQQATISDGKLISCPAHSCHSCIHRSIIDYKKKVEPREKLVRCTMCPGTYHRDEECIPAGAIRINSHQILCPRHGNHQNKPKTYVCQICVQSFSQSQSDVVRGCQTCPCLYHFNCLDVDDEQLMPPDLFACIYCRDGFFPRAGDVVWAKCGSSRWWPARILPRSAYPENMLTVKHAQDQFVVRFYGTNDHYWVSNKSTFHLQNEDDVIVSGSTTSKDLKFQQGLEEAIADAQDRELYFDSKVPLHYDSGLDKKPGNYRRIKNNLYVKPCRPLKEWDAMDEICRCKPSDPDPCGDGCVNKGLRMECSKDCPCGELCQNRRMQLHQDAPAELKHMGNKGWGLVAKEDLKRGTFIIEYVGEVLTKEEFQRRKQEYIKNKERHFYFLELSGAHYIDAKYKGNLSRFINHSCEPNCESTQWSVLGERRVGLFTLRDVKAGEELTFNYGWRSDGTNNQQCFCGTEGCSKSLAMEKLKKNNEAKGKKSGGRASMAKSIETEASTNWLNCDVCSTKFASNREAAICAKCYEQQEF